MSSLQLFVCTLVAASNAWFTVAQGVPPTNEVGYMKSLFVHGDHFSVGQQMGYATKQEIYDRFATSSTVESLIKWVSTSDYGKAAYDAMLNSANTTFPEYVEELEGMAYGSGVCFQNLFILNVRNELGTFKDNEQHTSNSVDKVDHCSDYLVNHVYPTPTNSRSEVILGHNEDGAVSERQKGCLITAHMEGSGVREQIRYTAFVYPGDLPSDAFFWNEHGIVGSYNGLYPATSLWGGLGRNFISRHTLGSTGIDDAVERASWTNQATGHSYNFATLSLADGEIGRIVNVEIAPGTDNDDPNDKSPHVAVTEITQQASDPTSNNSLFHANAYKFLTVNETGSESSAHRMARAAELPPPQDTRDVCVVLGDTEDEEWPIYRSGASASDQAYTLVTAVFTVHLDHSDVSVAADAVHSKPKFAPGSAVLYLSNPKTNAMVNLTLNSLAIQ